MRLSVGDGFRFAIGVLFVQIFVAIVALVCFLLIVKGLR
jgi:hypothetical protein